MITECGICEYSGDAASSPSFLCFNCADAIRRLVSIGNRRQENEKGSDAISQPTQVNREKNATQHRR